MGRRARAVTIAALAASMALVGLAASSGPAAAAPSAGAVSAGGTIQLTVAGQAGVPGDASAVVLNVTATAPAKDGFLTVYPCGQPRPLASNVNYIAGQSVPNLVIAKVGADGQVCIFSLQAADVIVDVSGYFPASSGFTPITNPQRILDTRAGVGAAASKLAGGQILPLQVGGVAGVPADAKAVVINTTVTGPTGPGFLTAFPCGQSPPLASNLNYVPGQTVANLVLAKLGTGGQLCLYSLAATDVVADVAGYFPAGSDFTPITNPQRILDTRTGLGAPAHPLPQFGGLGVQVGGVAGVPADASAVVLNVTATNTAGPGFVTVWPCGEEEPEVSNVNYEAGQTVPNSVIAKVGVGGQVCLSTFASADLVVDVAGYFPAGSSFTPIPNPRRILDTRPGECPYPAAAPGVNPYYGCVASIRTDMDGDGIPDPFIIYSETQDPKAIAEVDEWAAVQIHGTWYSYHIGLVDLLGTDTAVFKFGPYDTTPGDEVLYTDNVGAHIMSGGVLAWSPAGLELLPDGWTVDAGLYFGTGQRCVAGGVDVISYDTTFDAANNPASAAITVDHDVWQGRRLVTSTTETSTVALAPGQYAGDFAFAGRDSFDCPLLQEPYRSF